VPEHTERIAGSLVLSHFESLSLMSTQLSIGFNNSLYSDLELIVEVLLIIYDDSTMMLIDTTFSRVNVVMLTK